MKGPHFPKITLTTRTDDFSMTFQLVYMNLLLRGFVAAYTLESKTSSPLFSSEKLGFEFFEPLVEIFDADSDQLLLPRCRSSWLKLEHKYIHY
jgi:hypothetical protein